MKSFQPLWLPYLSNVPPAISKISLSLSVTVLLEKRLNATQRWQIPSWYLYGVAVGDSMTHQSKSGEKVGQSEQGEVFSFGGYKVTLYKDACERYWHALIGDKPLVYVVCNEDVESDEHDLPVEPLLVTIDYDEAVSHAETDGLVLSTTIPGELYRYMEAFVLQHYKPKPFEKRKRKKWVESAEGNN